MPLPSAADFKRRRSTRRRALLALALLLLGVVGWMYFNSVAGIHGMPTSEMDWNADGTVTRSEVLQAYHAVSAEQKQEGSRTCTTYYWRGTGESIRVDCRTEFEASGKAG